MSISSLEQRFRKTTEFLPFGSSTNSKAASFFPEEPALVERAKGCRLWDVDGREFIDFRNGLGPVSLGYAYPAIDVAIQEQLGRGIVFSHPHRLEGEVAERLCEVIPCAEMARFLKTGGEAMAACLRLARAFTKRDHVIQIGYNGWINSLAAGGMYRPGVPSENIPAGVPAALAELHHAGSWGDLDSLRRLFELLPGKIAAVTVAAGYANMGAGKEFYPALRKLTKEQGALLIFDEIVTGFRVATGGVQEYFGVTPDLAVFAKGMANGMPISTYCGRRDVMSLCARGGGVTVSSTYGGEALSLAAAKATIDIYQKENVAAALWEKGEYIWGKLNAIFAELGLPLAYKGFWPCPQLCAEQDAEAGLVPKFMRAAFANGVVLYGVSYVNYSHDKADLDEALERLRSAACSL